jgi:hypothetical protein
MIALIRTLQTPDGTFGRLILPDGQTFVTAEDDWLNNARRVSCIPAGTYPLRRRWSPKHKAEVFGVEDVPGRQDIEIHIGNTEEDVEGCILLGLRFGPLRVRDEDDPAHPWKEKNAALSSAIAFHRFMDALAHVDEETIAIEWGPGLPSTAAIV